MFIKSVVGSSQLVSPSRSSFSMEEATSFEELHEAQTKKNQLLQVSEIKFQEQIAGIDRNFEHFTHTLAPTSRFGNESVFGVFSQTPGDELSGSQNYVHTPLPRMDFSRFDGSNPRNWILQCNNYFKPMPSMSDAQRIDLAIRHFDGRAFSWIQDLNMGEIEITWKQFLEVVCARFEKLTVSNMMVELNELKQIGSYENYVERFEELRAYILLNDSYRYSEDSFVASFLSGLSEELQEFINLFQPTNLEQAIELGRNRIHTLDAFSKGMSPDSSSFQIQFPTFVGMIEEDHIIDAQKAKKMLPPDAEFGDVVVVEDDAGFMLTTWGDLNLISRKFSTLDPCGQASAAREGIVMAYVKKKGKVIEVGGREMSVLTSKSQATYEKNGDHVMTFAVFLNGKKVKLKSPTAAVESIFTTEHVLSSFTRKEKKDIEHIFVLGSDAKPDTSTLRLDFTLEEYSDAFDANGKKEERHFEMGVYKMNIPASYTILPTFHASLFQRCISTEIIPVGESLEDDVVEYNEPAFLSVPGKHYKIQSFSHGIQSELEFVVEVAAAYIFYKKGISVQKLPKVDANRNFKVQFLLALHTHRVNRTSQKIPHIPVQSVETRMQSVAPHPRIIEEFYLWFLYCILILILYSTQEYKEFQIFVQRMGLPETDSAESFKIESLMVLGTHIWKTFAQISVRSLTAKPESATGKVVNCLRCKLSTFDPWGQGSFSDGGIVMARVGVNCGVDDVKKRGLVMASDGVKLGMKVAEDDLIEEEGKGFGLLSWAIK